MEKSKPSREYPPVYEKIIPIALWVIGMVVTVLILVTIAVALR